MQEIIGNTNKDNLFQLSALESQILEIKALKTKTKKNQLTLADAYKSLADIHFIQSNYSQAGQLFSNALVIYARLKNHTGLIICQNAQASICLAKGELAAAQSKLQGLVNLFKSHPQPELEHKVLNNMGIVYEKMGDLPRAVLYYHRSLAIKNQLNNPLLPTYTLHNLANIYLQVEDYDTALKYNNKALDILILDNDINAEATILNGLAKIYSKKGMQIEANGFYIKAKLLAGKGKNLAQMAQADAGLGHLAYKKGNFAKAKKLLDKSLLSFRDLQEQEYIVRCLIDLARINQNQIINEALGQIQEATRICKINGFRALLADVYELTAKLKATQENYKKAYYYQKMFFELYKETNRINILNQVEVNTLSIELENSQSKSKQFQKQATQLEHESMHDHLTGAGNRRQLDRILAENWKQSIIQSEPNHLAMLDIDDFKKINDHFSHTIGDKVLQSISSIIQDNIREHDKLFRYGGEEFIILIKDNSTEVARKIFNRIREHIQTNKWSELNNSLKVTATLGMVSNTEFQLIDKALKVADDRMYQGKNTGKNKLIYE